jgi:hypothetical protein
MCLICKSYVRFNSDLKELYCYSCPLLKEIPNIISLITIDCSNCKIERLPIRYPLKLLYCNSCPNIKEIPNILGLEILYCNYCPELKEIPYCMSKLKIIVCDEILKKTLLPGYYYIKKLQKRKKIKTLTNILYKLTNYEESDICYGCCKIISSYII